ncbi:MAG TPA: universal stress protein [Planctomycetaceae bacterium]|nr:universal stress protein [Planctomycetaceae bacterium]
MIQLHRVLLATDFSDCSRAAQAYACNLVEQFGGELHVLHVLADPVLMMPEPGTPASLPQNYLVDLKESAEKMLDGLIPAEWASRYSVRRATRLGSPGPEIVRYAEEHQIDLIVLGTHGRGAVAHLLLGSVAERVVRQAKCPVLTFRPST